MQIRSNILNKYTEENQRIDGSINIMYNLI